MFSNKKYRYKCLIDSLLPDSRGRVIVLSSKHMCACMHFNMHAQNHECMHVVHIYVVCVPICALIIIWTKF